MDTKIAIFGTGNVGGQLAANATRHGLRVCLGTRPESDPSQVLARCGELAEACPYAEAAAWADLVFLATTTEAAAAVARSVAGELAGKVLVDCTNPVGWDDGPVHDPPPAGSVTAELAAVLPGVRVVKGFCTFGAEIHGNPDLRGEAAHVLLAGEDANAKQEVARLAEHLGFAPVDAGLLRNAALLEQMAILWIHLALQGRHGREWAFQLRGRS